MEIDATTGRLDAARQVSSPNFDERPTGCDLELIVIHSISLPPGEFGGGWVDDLFTNTLDPDAHPYFSEIQGMEVSAHVLIRRDGELVQYVPFHRRAWHAGKSEYCGRERCNDFSIGIELEGADDVAYDDRQYPALASVVAALIDTYPTLSRAKITGHEHIAPGRKTDPGPAFDWRRFHTLLNKLQ